MFSSMNARPVLLPILRAGVEPPLDPAQRAGQPVAPLVNAGHVQAQRDRHRVAGGEDQNGSVHIEIPFGDSFKSIRSFLAGSLASRARRIGRHATRLQNHSGRSSAANK